ncbi:MAG TPA: tetratricopeptide repeat protein, partial [Pyrinomonadaceae bacterium]
MSNEQMSLPSAASPSRSNVSRNAQHLAPPLSRATVTPTLLLLLALSASPSFSQSQPPRTPSKAQPGKRDAAADNVPARLREAAALLRSGKPDEAEPLVRRAIAAAPRDADAHNLLGVILDQRGRSLEAEREYRLSLN